MAIQGLKIILVSVTHATEKNMPFGGILIYDLKVMKYL